MEGYVKTAIFAVVLAICTWEIMCIAPQGPTLIKPDSSSSFIQQESGQTIPNRNQLSAPQNPVLNNPGSRDYVNPNRGAQNGPVGGLNGGQNSGLNSGQTSGQNSPTSGQILPQVPGPNRQSTRDYVNPNRGGQTAPTGAQNVGQNSGPSSGQNIPTIGQNLPQTPAPTKGSGRDYVNPNWGGQSGATSGQNNPNSGQNAPVPGPISGQNVPQTPGPNRGGSRDYVAPNRAQIGQNGQQSQRGAVSGYANPTGQSSPQNGQLRPSPRNTNLGGRSYANIAGANSPTNSLQGANFPALPSRNNPQGAPSVQSTTPLSYASKVSGGATTKSPIGKPAVGPTSSSTPKSEDGPSDAELREFSEALLRRDVNNAAKFLTLNVQGKTTSQSKKDEAPDKLLTVQADGYQISTISKLKLLHNNYVLNVMENEYVTPQEKQEENDLLEAMLTTPIMQYTRNFLVTKGKIGRDPKDFKDLLKLLWFNMYSRGGGRIGSSGFEHIFVAELKKNEVSGLHNWVYFDQAELNKIVDYLGYMKKIDLGEKGAILKFHFKLNGVDKPVGSMFIGTSPELEMALYTTCYMFRADKICPLRLNGNNFIIRTYNYRYRGKNLIGSGFPEI